MFIKCNKCEEVYNHHSGHKCKTMANKPNKIEVMANNNMANNSSTYKYRDKESRKVYMREYMRRKRNEEEVKESSKA